jgi:hypothetical protein
MHKRSRWIRLLSRARGVRRNGIPDVPMTRESLIAYAEKRGLVAVDKTAYEQLCAVAAATFSADLDHEYETLCGHA